MPKATRTQEPPAPWSHRRIIGTLAVLGLVAVLGVGLWVRSTLTPAPTTGPAARSLVTPAPVASTPVHESAEARRDRLAAAPMARVPADAIFPQPLSTAEPDRIAVPAGSEIDRLGVAVGFPNTPEGALGQLAGIDRAAFSVLDVDLPRRVITEWAAPGGPTAESWSGVRAMTELLSAAQLPAGSAVYAELAFTPSMGLIKGTVGPDFVVACVNGELALTISGHTERVAVSDCQRMTWNYTTSRWEIGHGSEPVPAPSAWPGSQVALDAGWKVIDYVG